MITFLCLMLWRDAQASSELVRDSISTRAQRSAEADLLTSSHW